MWMGNSTNLWPNAEISGRQDRHDCLAAHMGAKPGTASTYPLLSACRRYHRWRKMETRPYRKKFLFPAKAMSKVFRAKYVSNLMQLISSGKIETPDISVTLLKNRLYKRNWVVYAKPPFKHTEQVIKYLGRYTHRVAITNSRIIDIAQDSIQFRWKDYRDLKNKTMNLSAIEFLRRFCLHILPLGYRRIRHFGILCNLWFDPLNIRLSLQG